MITTGTHSLSALAEWGNNAFNNVNGTTPELQQSFRQVLKAGIKKANYPSCEAELAIIDEINDFDVTPIAEQLPNALAKYMAETGRAVNLPAPDENTAPATLKFVHKEEAVNTGIIQMGDKKGQPYESKVKAHDEYALKQNKKAFKD
jgi:hypothetical protein